MGAKEYSYKRNPGQIVMTQSGTFGRTFNSKGLINGKVPVYLCTTECEYQGQRVPMLYSDQGTLCDPKTLTLIGHID